jgi:hypothetical protein
MTGHPCCLDGSYETTFEVNHRTFKKSWRSSRLPARILSSIRVWNSVQCPSGKEAAIKALTTSVICLFRSNSLRIQASVSLLVTGSFTTGKGSKRSRRRNSEGTFRGTDCVSVELDDLLPENKMLKSRLEGGHGLGPARSVSKLGQSTIVSRPAQALHKLCLD